MRISTEQQFPNTRATRLKRTHTREEPSRYRRFRRLHNEEPVGYWYQWGRDMGTYRVYVRAARPRPISFMSSRFLEQPHLVNRYQHTRGHANLHTSAYIYPETHVHSSFSMSDLSCRSCLRPRRPNCSQKGVT